MIKTAPELIDALGGTKAVASAIGVSMQAVSNAKKAGKLPGGWHMRIYRIAQRKRVKIDPRLVGDVQ